MITVQGLLKLEDLEGTCEEVLKRLAGVQLPPTNGWARGVVVGAWKLRRKEESDSHIRLLIASPTADNPVQLFNEDSRMYLEAKA